MLWKCFIKYNGTNEYVEELRYSEGALKMDTAGIQSSYVSLFKYKTDRPSVIFTSTQDGKKYLVPEWREVHPDTTINDIEYIKPKPKPVKEKLQSFKVKDYIIKYNSDRKLYTCNCQGYFRVKDKSIGCKHIQQVKAGQHD